MGRRIVEKPWTVVATDVMGPFPRSRAGFAYVVVMQDLFSKWIKVRALHQANGKKIRDAIEDLVITRWGTPKYLLTDNGTEFVNRVMCEFAKERGITHTTIPPYHPQANPVERATPAFVNLGRELELSNSLKSDREGVGAVEAQDAEVWATRMRKLKVLHKWVAENLEQAHQRQAATYNLRRRHRVYQVGDLVLKRQHTLSSAAQNIAAKLTPKFSGPFKITRKLSSVVCEFERLDGGSGGKSSMEDWQAFAQKYAELWDELDDRFPAFWAELGELVEFYERSRYTTEGAVVRDFPTTREAATQTRGSPRSRTRETQTDPVREPEIIEIVEVPATPIAAELPKPRPAKGCRHRLLPRPPHRDKVSWRSG
ncbi:uncharacterized protein LOC116853697 [Odontomachus brunneus]|uniref:uncharacterized protein LOC116853697 n=1 Tax=Odontomachus brunneus TaxID=486640 RepID=UPI0013F2AA3E|nr:uncharacterized protein LOC116853697 [Odontomachus brunneus]